VPGRIRGKSVGVALGQVDVVFVAEEDSAAPHVFVLIDGARGVPEVGGELAVSAGEEVVALGIVLADEENVGCVATGSSGGDPLPLKPRREAKETPPRRRRPVALMGETHRTKQMERNKWGETSQKCGMRLDPAALPLGRPSAATGGARTAV
jgi:hypothetical protein